MHRLDQAHLTARVNDCLYCSHLEEEFTTASDIRKPQITLKAAIRTAVPGSKTLWLAVAVSASRIECVSLKIAV